MSDQKNTDGEPPYQPVDQRLTEGAADANPDGSADQIVGPFNGLLDYIRWSLGIGWRMAYVWVGDDQIETHWTDRWTKRHLVSRVKADGARSTTQVEPHGR